MICQPFFGIIFLIIFWVLRTLYFRRSSCEQLRKYGNWAPGKGLCPLHSRQPFKKGWTLNFLCQPPFPRDRAQQSKRFGPAYPHPAEEKLSIPHQIQSSRSDTFTCPEGTYITGPKGLYHNAQHYITRPQGGYHWNEKAGRVSVLLLVPSYTPYFAVETLTPGPMVEATTQLLK